MVELKSGTLIGLGTGKVFGNGGGGGGRVIYHGARTGTGTSFAGSPIYGVSGTVEIERNIRAMTMKGAYLLSTGTETYGTFDCLYTGGRSAVTVNYSAGYWWHFGDSDENPEKSRAVGGLFAANRPSWTLEYTPSTGVLSLLAIPYTGRAPANIPAVTDLLLVEL